ncbi:MAG: cupin domain-containing protein [Actinobacteria bacterium]|nr:cupin domain-containing protein [Actinomycetota bacterium]
MAGFTIKHRDDLDREGKWLLARRSLEVGSFGMNLVELAPGESIPEHDETDRDQEEVFYVVDGDAVIVIDGQDHASPAGTFVRLDPHVRRTARNDGDAAVTLMMVSAPRSSGYEPMSWA